MCGFAGFVSVTGERAPEDVLIRMTEKIAKRGPDDSGEYFDKYAGFGFRRLSIVGLGNGHQPMENETNDMVPVSYTHLDVYKRQGCIWLPAGLCKDF